MGIGAYPFRTSMVSLSPYRGDPTLLRVHYQTAQEVKLVCGVDPRSTSSSAGSGGIHDATAKEGGGGAHGATAPEAVAVEDTAESKSGVWVFPYFQRDVAENDSV